MGKTAVWREEKNAFSGGKRGNGMVGQKLFFTNRNTAVRGAEVPILPLHFPLKKSRIGTAGTWTFQE